MADPTSVPVVPETTPQASPEPAAPTPAQGEHAPSPSAPPDQGVSRESLLDAVQQAVPGLRPSQQQQDDEGGATPAPAAKPDQAAASAAKPDDFSDLSDDIPAEEMAQYRQQTQRRFHKLLGQRNDARQQVEALTGEVGKLKALEPSAQAAESVQKYLRDNDIGRDDFLMLLELGSAMRRGDFRTFYEGVKPYVQLAEEYLGLALPADLHQAVQQGQMTTQAAQQMSRTRMDGALAQSQRLRQQQLFEQNNQMIGRQNLGNAVTAAVASWEQQMKQQDPDYAAKEPLLRQIMWAVVEERGRPQTPEHAVAIAQEAYKRSGEFITRYKPPPRPTMKTPSSTGRTNGAVPEPGSLKEAVQQALERARA